MAMNERNKPQPTPLSAVPSKIFYSISEASEYTGVEPHVLRYWETKFSKLNPKRVSGNQRKYTRNDLELLYEIVRLLYYEGYTLDGAERKLRQGLQSLRAERDTEKEKPLPPEEIPSAPAPVVVETVPDNQITLRTVKEELKSILSLLE